MRLHPPTLTRTYSMLASTKSPTSLCAFLAQARKSIEESRQRKEQVTIVTGNQSAGPFPLSSKAALSLIPVRPRYPLLLHPLRLSSVHSPLTTQHEAHRLPCQKISSPTPHIPLRPLPPPGVLRRLPPRANQPGGLTNNRRPCPIVATINFRRLATRPPANFLDTSRPQQARRPARRYLRGESGRMHRPPRRRGRRAAATSGR